MLQQIVFASDPISYREALDRFKLGIRDRWDEGFLIATDSLRIVVDERGIIFAAIVEREEEA